MQSLATTWLLAGVAKTSELVQLGLSMTASEAVGNRLGRIEPRANKRRPKIIALLTKPRHAAIQELKQAT